MAYILPTTEALLSAGTKQQTKVQTLTANGSVSYSLPFIVADESSAADALELSEAKAVKVTAPKSVDGLSTFSRSAVLDKSAVIALLRRK